MYTQLVPPLQKYTELIVHSVETIKSSADQLLSATWQFNTYSIVRTPKKQNKQVWVTPHHLWDSRELWVMQSGIKVGITQDRLAPELLSVFQNLKISGKTLERFCQWLDKRYVERLEQSRCKLERSLADAVYNLVKQNSRLARDRKLESRLATDSIRELVRISLSPTVPNHQKISFGHKSIANLRKSVLAAIAIRLGIPSNERKDALKENIVNGVIRFGLGRNI